MKPSSAAIGNSAFCNILTEANKDNFFWLSGSMDLSCHLICHDPSCFFLTCNCSFRWVLWAVCWIFHREHESQVASWNLLNVRTTKSPAIPLSVGLDRLVILVLMVVPAGFWVFLRLLFPHLFFFFFNDLVTWNHKKLHCQRLQFKIYCYFT